MKENQFEQEFVTNWDFMTIKSSETERNRALTFSNRVNNLKDPISLK